MKFSNIPRGWVLALKICVSTGLVVWIVRGVDLDKVTEVLRQANVPLLIFAFILFFVGYLLTSVRWRLLMSVHGVYPPLFIMVQSFMVGIFFNNLLPSTIGGDLSRMYDVWRIVRDKVSAVSIVLVDRFMGILALVLWASIAVLMSPEIRDLSAVTVPVSIVLILGIVVTGFIFGRPRRFVRACIQGMRDLCSRGPDALKRPGFKMLDAFGPYYEHNRVLVRAFMVSLLLQLNVIIHFWLVATALHIDISIFELGVVIPCAFMIMMLPISVNAIGVREVVFVYFMGLFGVDRESAVVFAWIAFLFVIIQGLLGGLVFALRRSPPDLSAQDRDTVQP